MLTYLLTDREVKQLGSSKQLNSVLAHFVSIPGKESVRAAEREQTQPHVRVSWLSVNNTATLIALNLCFAYPTSTGASFAVGQQQQQPTEFFTSICGDETLMAEDRSTLMDRLHWQPDSCIYIWQVELDRFQVFDFLTGECRPFGATPTPGFMPTALSKNDWFAAKFVPHSTSYACSTIFFSRIIKSS